MDLTETISPKSDQLDYEDFLGGPRTLTITEVRRGPSGEQPIEIAFAEVDRPWRPAKTMRRVLVAAWTADGETYVGRRVTLFGDPSVKWAGAEVGGIRLSHLSHITEPLSLSLTVTRGKRAPYVVQPLSDAPAPKSLSQRITEAVGAFGKIGVTAAQLEESVGKPQKDWQPDDLAELVTVYQSIKKGDVTVDEAFPKPEEPEGWK